jgi:alpha-1,3-rhamnosyl/mannosyltransferase
VCNAITWPHKNHPLLVEAFAAVAYADTDVDLVLTGGEASGEGRLRDEIARHRLEGRVRRTGRIPQADLDGLLTGATALTFPSRFEGFGAPVLEAMSRGCPVIAADATALPEVVGDAGILVPADDAAAWSGAMTALLHDDARRSSLAAAGRARVAGFGWDASAAALEAAYRDALDQPQADATDLVDAPPARARDER